MTQTQPQKTTTDKEQRNRFRKAAREAGCDDNEERFQEALRKVAKGKPSAQVGEKRREADRRSGKNHE